MGNALQALGVELPEALECGATHLGFARPVLRAAARTGRASLASCYSRTTDASFQERFHNLKWKGPSEPPEGMFKCAILLFQDTKVGVQRVVKTYGKAVLCAEAGQRASVETEIEMGLAADHPGIVRLLEVIETEASLHLVLEALEGGEVLDRVNDLIEAADRAMDEREVASAARQMLSALAHLHMQGAVHRDIKPENFVYEAKGGGRLKLIDFGISRFLDAADSEHALCNQVASPELKTTPPPWKGGTWCWMAPEEVARQLRFEEAAKKPPRASRAAVPRCVDPKLKTTACDLWSLGAVLLWMLTGWNPYDAVDETHSCHPWQVNFEKQSREHEDFRCLSAAAQSFLKGLLCIDARSRMTAEQALQHPWIRSHSHNADPRCTPASRSPPLVPMPTPRSPPLAPMPTSSSPPLLPTSAPRSSPLAPMPGPRSLPQVPASAPRSPFLSLPSAQAKYAPVSQSTPVLLGRTVAYAGHASSMQKVGVSASFQALPSSMQKLGVSTSFQVLPRTLAIF